MIELNKKRIGFLIDGSCNSLKRKLVNISEIFLIGKLFFQKIFLESKVKLLRIKGIEKDVKILSKQNLLRFFEGENLENIGFSGFFSSSFIVDIMRVYRRDNYVVEIVII